MKYFSFNITSISKEVITFLVWIVQICIKMVEVISQNLKKCVIPRLNLPIIALRIDNSRQRVIRAI